MAHWYNFTFPSYQWGKKSKIEVALLTKEQSGLGKRN